MKERNFNQVFQVPNLLSCLFVFRFHSNRLTLEGTFG